MRVPAALFVGLVGAACLAAGSVRAANLTVTSTADSGAGSLRQAITDANGNGQADVITFAPAMVGQTIAATSTLPNFVESNTVIDGDLDDDCDPDVNLSGAGAGNVAAFVIPSSTSNITVRGLAIHSWQQSAFSMGAAGAIVECNHIGTDTGGSAVLQVGANNAQSVLMTGSGMTIGPGNLIVNGRGAGIRVIEITSSAYPDFTSLSSDSAPRIYPVVDFSENCGSFSGSGFTPLDGSGRPFTDNFGMRLRGRITVGAVGTYAFNFGQLDDNARLRIDGGVIADLSGPTPPIQNVALAAGAHTIEIDFREGTGSSRLSLAISGPGTATLSSDDQALCAIGQPGLCAELFQIRVASTGNRFTRNRIRDNSGLGIQLSNCSIANDAGDTDVGPNTLLNSPVITGLTAIGGGDFTVTGTAPANSVVELFQAAADPSGFGEGATFLAQATASAGGNFAVVTPLAASGVLTATATDTSNNTSEFGKNFAYSTGASGLYADGRSSSSIELTWIDPNLGETGFRVERSTNGTTFAPVTTVGPNVTTHLDTLLSANTLYYYRVIATSAAGDAPASNRAGASTYPATAAQVCFQRFDRAQSFALSPAVQFDGTAWAVAWSERDITRDNIDLMFRRFDATTLAPLAPIVPISTEDMNVFSPVHLAWNGQHHGIVWTESLRGAAGSTLDLPTFFALLDVNGSRIRGHVRVPVPDPTFEPLTLLWDGAGWGLLGTTTDDDPTSSDVFTDVYLLRMTEDGHPIGAPVLLTSTATQNESLAVPAWSPQKSQYGVAFVRGRDNDYQLLFQRFAADGAPVDPSPTVLDTFQFTAGVFGNGTGAVYWDGTNWAIANSRDDPTNMIETPVFLYRVDGTSGALLSGPVRLSDDPVDPGSLVTAVLGKPDGGYAVFTSTVGLSNQLEVARMQATAAGARDGTLTFISPNDGQQSIRASIATNGTHFLVTYGVGGGSAIQPSEIFAVRVAADGLTAPPAPVALTAGHDPVAGDIPRGMLAAPLGAGFVGAWVDGPTPTPKINARIWNGSGQIVSTLSPINAAITRGAFSLVGVGNTFALAWKTPANDVIFARYNASGGPITGEKTVATATGGGSNIVLRWNGEHYALFYQSSGTARFLRVDDNGNAIGSPVPMVRAPDGSATVQWLGDSWAMATRSGAASGNVDYIRLAPDGTLLNGPVALFTPLHPFRGVRSQSLAYTGHAFGIAYTDWSGLDPPGDDLYFALLNRDGSQAVPPASVLSTGFGEQNARLYAAGDEFRLVDNGFGQFAGLHEQRIAADGTVLPNPRFISNRVSGIGAVATAFNGVTTGTLYFASGLQHLYFHTSACLADATPPPCPTLATGFANGAVQASWNTVTDAESGVIRYVLYRDGLPLAELDPDVLSYADGGYDSTGNTYQIRALNGAFVESASCPTQTPDVNSIFADGFE